MIDRNVAVYVVLAGIALAAADAIVSPYYERLLVLVAINVLLATSLNLTNGYTGDFSLGHAAFMAIGAYTAGVLTLPVTIKAILLADAPEWIQGVSLPFPVATVIGGLLAASAAIVVGVPVLRLKGHYLAVATLGLMVIVRVLINNWESVTRGAKGMSALPPATDLWWAWGWAGVTIYLLWRLVHSPVGRAMVAIREDTLAAATRGVRVFRTRLVAFVVSAFLAGVGGSLFAHHVTVIAPTMFSFAITFTVVVMLVVGGMGSITGSVAGAILITVISEYLREAEASITFRGSPLYALSQFIVAALVIFIMILRRQGLLGGRELHLPRLFGRAGAAAPTTLSTMWIRKKKREDAS